MITQEILDELTAAKAEVKAAHEQWSAANEVLSEALRRRRAAGERLDAAIAAVADAA